ncbi:MAG TPA: aminotransferase class I/II-fold pyridoxal phosphate-dependent enzyme [Firmicutes bacterium]|nr:aminotransferase class I/II-fold pyridoxal phosphate-dependent enzyme [Bacillota bacterium]
MHRKITAVVKEKQQAPFFEELVRYASKSNDSWHTPGHSSGDSVKHSPWVSDYYEFFGHNMFASDISVSVPALDSLLDPKPEGVISKAQELAARAFRAKRTFFVTNGTSTSNKILLQTLLKPGEAILLDRNCHKSVHYGIIAAGAEPVYLIPSVNNKYGIFGPIPKKRLYETMDNALAAGKKLKALILTNCTYDGLIYDLEEIIAEAHKRGLKVIIDEAWFGYANFHPGFYPCAMAAGADYATQSTHKTMSAFSQASMIHVNDPDFESIEDFFMENYMLYSSTSPGYPMIASLDVARKQMIMEGYRLLSNALQLAEDLREAVNSLDGFRTLEANDLISEELSGDGIRLDRTKVTVDITQSGYSNKKLEHLLLNDYGIQVEKTTFNTMTFLITIGTTRSKINRLFLALEALSKRKGAGGVLRPAEPLQMMLSDMKFLPRHAFYCEGTFSPAQKCDGRIAAGMVVPYPPGIPILVPGQVITKEIITYLLALFEKGVEIHGMQDGYINILTPEEEVELVRRGWSISS